jgi:hypothetical protein
MNRRVVGLLLTLAGLSLCSSPLHAQEEDRDPKDELGIWLQYFGKNRFSDRSSFHSELQLRQWELFQNVNQFLVRVGYHFDIDPDNMASAGYTFVDTSPFDDSGLSTNEHQLWQQFLQRAKLGRVAFEHRFRVEERWILEAADTDFLMRLRYRILVNVALGRPATSPFFLSFYDEVMVNLEGDAFDQNRLYGAFAYALDDRGSSVQVGYMLNTFSGRHLHRLQVAFFFNPDLRPGSGREGEAP